MMFYEKYLSQQNYSSSTIAEYIRRNEKFTTWALKNEMDADQIIYRQLMEYIQHLQDGNYRKASINNELSALKTYFKYLIFTGERVDNPAEGLLIKGVKKKTAYNLLDSDELEDLYYSYEAKSIKRTDFRIAAQRNKVMVGFMVYQGLNTTNLQALEINHAQVYKGKLEVPRTRRSNARSLDLKPWQVVQLMEYVNEIRPQIALQRNRNIKNEKLFIPNNRLKQIVNPIIKQLKQSNLKIEALNQIRASVIVNWLKHHNMRKVQYFAGHKYISSTEKYRQDNLEHLQEVVTKFHPLQ